MTFWLGLALVMTGLVLVGWFAWQLFGTNLVAKRKREEQVAGLRQAWEAGDAPSPEAGPVPIGRASALVRIPRFGPSYVMPVLEGTSGEVLSQGFAHFEDSAAPGAVGNYALAAHRVTHGEPLRRMPELRPGDEVIVETAQAVYTYVLDTDPEELVVPFTAGWVLEDFPVNPEGGVGPDPADGKRVVTLTTCSELFHTDDRMIAFGHLEAVERKPERHSVRSTP